MQTARRYASLSDASLSRLPLKPHAFVPGIRLPVIVLAFQDRIGDALGEGPAGERALPVEEVPAPDALRSSAYHVPPPFTRIMSAATSRAMGRGAGLFRNSAQASATNSAGFVSA